MRQTASKKLQRKRKAEAMNGGSEKKASKDEPSSKEIEEKDVSKGAEAKNAVAAPPAKKQRHISEDADSGDDKMDVDKDDSGTKKVTKLPGDPFTAVRSNLIAQNTTSSAQHTATATPASKIAKLSAKQTTLIFNISPPVPPHSVETPRKPSDYSDRAMAPTKMTNAIPKTVTGGASGASTVPAVTKSKDSCGSEQRGRSLEEVRRGAKDAKEGLALVQDDALSTATVTGETHSSPTCQSIFGPAVRAEDQAVEGIEERDARQEKLKSESVEAMNFDNLPVASPSQELDKSVVEKLAADPVADTAADTAADLSVDKSVIAIASKALQVSEAAAHAQASDSEDTIIVRPEVPVIPSTMKDKPTNKGAVDGSGVVTLKGTVARRSGVTSSAKLKGGPKKSDTTDIKPGTVNETKRGSTNDNPITPVSKADNPMVSASIGGNGETPASPSRLLKNKDGSLARKPKSASTSATKEVASTKQAKPVASVAKTAATTPANPTAASATKSPAATQANPTAPTSNGAVKNTAPTKTHATPASPTSTNAMKNPAPTNSATTIFPPGAPQAIMQTIQPSPTPPNHPIIFLITIEAPSSPEPSTQIYHPFTLSTPFHLFSATISEQLGQDEKQLFASASKGQISYPGMATARFPVAMPMVGTIWASITKKLAGVVGKAEAEAEAGEVVTVTFS